MRSETYTLELDREVAELLERRAARDGMSISDYVAGLLRAPAGEAEQGKAALVELRTAWAAVESGEATESGAAVRRWLGTWGTPSFKPWHGDT